MCGLVGGDVAQRVAQRQPCARRTRQAASSSARARPRPAPPSSAGQRRARHVAGPLRVRVRQVRAAELQPRRSRAPACRRARIDSFVKPRVGQRQRVGRSRAIAIWRASTASSSDCGASRRRTLARRRRRRPRGGSARRKCTLSSSVTTQEQRQHDRRRTAPAGSRNTLCQVARRFGAARARARRRPDEREQQQPEHDVGPEQDELAACVARRSGEPDPRIGPGVGDVDQRCSSRCRAATPTNTIVRTIAKSWPVMASIT